MTVDQIPCRALVELLTDYLDDALEPSLAARVDAHLAGCRGCGSFLAQLRRSIDLTGHLAADVAEQMPTEMRDALLAAYRGD